MNPTDYPTTSKAQLDRFAVLSAHNLFTLDGALGTNRLVAWALISATAAPPARLMRPQARLPIA
jgi:hypothetical protein